MYASNKFALFTCLYDKTNKTLISAPEAPGMVSAILRRLMPRVRFILREWMRRISRRALRVCASMLRGSKVE